MLNVPLVPPSLNKYARFHWTKRNALHEEWNFTIWVLLKEARIPFCQKVDVQVCIFFAYPRSRDTDNYTATAYKLILDALKRHVFRDDTPEHVTMHPVTWMTDKALPRTEITITEID